MPAFLSRLFNLPSRRLFLVLFAAGLWFLLISWEYAVSLTMFGLGGLCLFQWYPERGRWGWRETIPEGIRRWRQDPSWLLATLPFWIVVLSGFVSEDGAYLGTRIQLKIPFLVLPLAFAGLPVGDRRTYLLLHYLLLLLVSLASLQVLATYLQDPAFYNSLLLQGRPLPTPSNHIRFSMTAALAFGAGLYLYASGFTWRRAWERKLQALLLSFLFVFLHLLAVRTGLLLLYAGILLWILRLVIVRRKYLLGAGLAALLALAPLIAYRTVPAFTARIDYMRWDIQQHLLGNRIDNSDSNRLVSMKIGWEIFREKPWTGIGMGDLRAEVEARYREQAPSLKPLIPHNQWLCTLAGAGIPGALLFTAFALLPALLRKRFRNYLFLLLVLTYFLSYLVEPTLESNFGISLLLFFLLPAFRQEDVHTSMPR
jgi:O-antigen ligase